MATKTKKITSKKAEPKKTAKKHHHWHPHDFLLVVAGGFVVIVLIFLTSESFRFQFFPRMSQSVIEEEVVETDVMEKQITIEEFSYSPNPISVPVGTTVTWTNTDAEVHSATSDDGVFNTEALEKGESGSVTFTEPGEYHYHCAYHPNMTGTITVTE